MRPHSLRPHSPVGNARAESCPEAVPRERLRAVDEVIARVTHLRTTEQALDLDTEAERHKQVFANTSKALREQLRSIEARLAKAESGLAAAHKNETREVRSLQTQRNLALEKRAKLDETVVRLSASQAAAESQLLGYTAERIRQSALLAQAVAARDAAGASRALLDDADTLDELHRQARAVLSHRTAEELTAIVCRHVDAWRVARPDLAHIADRLASPESLNSIRVCLEQYSLTHAVLMKSEQEMAIHDQFTRLALTDTLARGIRVEQWPVPLLIGVFCNIVIMLDAAYHCRKVWLQAPDAATLNHILDLTRVAENLAHAVSDARAADPAFAIPDAAAGALKRTTALMRSFYTHQPSGRALMRWALDAFSTQTELLNSCAAAYPWIPTPGPDTAREIHVAHRRAEGLRQGLVSSDIMQTSHHILKSTGARTTQMLMLSMLLLITMGMLMFLVKPAVTMLRTRSASRVARERVSDMSGAILAGYKRIPAVAQLKAQGGAARAAVQRHTWSSDPSGPTTPAMQQHFFTRLRYLRETLRARFTEQLKPHDEAIHLARTALASTDTRLAACHEVLEKLRLTLPQKTRERATLQASIEALEQEIGARAVDDRTRDNFDRVRMLSLEAEIVMHMLAKKKEDYLASLREVLSRYHTRLAMLNAEREQLAILTASPAYIAARESAQQFITAAAWRRVMERHQGLTPESLKSRIANGHFETAQGQTVSTAPVERASSYHHEAHVLVAIFEAAAVTPEAAQSSPYPERTLRLNHDREVGRVMTLDQNSAREAPATTSRVTFALQRDGQVRITHLHPDE